MASSDIEIFRILQQETDWEQLILEMTAFGLWLTRNNSRWRGGDLPAGNQVKDLVLDVVLKTLTGRREWDPDKGELKPWLMDQVRSEVSNLFDRAVRRREVRLEREDGGLIEGIEHSSSNQDFNNPPSTPEAIVIGREEADRDKMGRLVDGLYKAIEGDKELEDIYFAVLEGCERKPRILARELGVPVLQINNALKRLDRKVRTVERQLRNANE